MTKQLKGIYELHSDDQVYFADGRRECWVGAKDEETRYWLFPCDLDEDYRESLAKDKQLGPIQLVKWRD